MIGGMMAASVIGIFFVPGVFYLVEKWSCAGKEHALGVLPATPGPNYHRPAVNAPTVYHDLNENPQLQARQSSYADLPWWQVFQDAQLHTLIRTALKQNYDLQLATERINAARAQVAIT